MAFERVVFTIPKDLLCELDSAILTDHVTRSQYIREAIILKMQLDNVIGETVSSRDSMEHIVRLLHLKRLSLRERKMRSSLSWAEAQD